MNARIIGTGSYVPEKEVSNNDIAELVETNDDWIRERTGICSRRIDRGEGTVAMAAKAARAALENAGVSAQELDLMIVATSTADQLFPNTACSVQEKLQAAHCMAYDLNAACSGFLYALETVQAFIASGMIKTALIIGTEDMSKVVDWNDRSTCILFGDGAGAAVVQASEEFGVIGFSSGADGSGGKAILCDALPLENPFSTYKGMHPKLYMEGREVFQFAVRTVPAAISDVLKKTGISLEEVDYFLLHQANERIIQSVARRLKAELRQFPMNLSEYGNTSAASVPILLDECNRRHLFSPGDLLVLSGFGAGLTWSAGVIRW